MFTTLCSCQDNGLNNREAVYVRRGIELIRDKRFEKHLPTSLLVSLVVVQVCAYVSTTRLQYFVLIFDDVYLVSEITGYSQ